MKLPNIFLFSLVSLLFSPTLFATTVAKASDPQTSQEEVEGQKALDPEALRAVNAGLTTPEDIASGAADPVNSLSMPIDSEGNNKGARSSDRHQGIEITVNINTAPRDELAKLLIGIGDKKAALIIEYRQQHGRFTSADDLIKVKGIGPSIVEKNRKRILL